MEHHDKKLENLGYWVITVSDTRTEEDDHSGNLIKQKMKDAGHALKDSSIVPDDGENIIKAVKNALSSDADVIILTGGTGIASRDVTIEAIGPIFDRELPGFGELFRVLSFHEIGPKAMLSRAVAGISNKKVIFCLPGSVKAVALGLEKLIIPEIGHLLWEVRR